MILRFTAFLLFAAAANFSVAGPKFDALKKKLEMTKVPVEKTGPVVSYADVIEKVSPAVVSIFAGKKGQGARGLGLGSGVLISKEGHIITNHHVIADSDSIRVAITQLNREYEAEVIGSDPSTDVAIIKIKAQNLPRATLADSSKVRVGDVVLAIGNPFELRQTVTMGIVSALGRNNVGIVGYENFIQTDASINPGNSGGALIDAGGRVIGINTAIASRTGGNMGIGFAIPIDMALKIVGKLLDEGEVSRGFLGVSMQNLDLKMSRFLKRKDLSGALITQVVPNSPADEAGIKNHDLILGYQGEAIQDMSQFRLRVGNTPPGKEVKFKILRGDKELVVTAELKKRNAANLAALGSNKQRKKKASKAPAPKGPVRPDRFIKGTRIADLSDILRRRYRLAENVNGVVITNVERGTPGWESGLREGDMLLDLDQIQIDTIEHAIGVNDHAKENHLVVRIRRNGGYQILVVSRK